MVDLDGDAHGEWPTGADAGRASARDSLALIEQQSNRAARSLSVDPVRVLGAWGIAWLGGFGAVYLASARRHAPLLSGWLAGVVLGVLFALAVAVTLSESLRRGRGVEGPSRQLGAMYGWGWGAALAALFAVNMGLAHQGLASALRPLVWSGSALLVVGLMYMTAGIVWRDRVQYGLGVWTLIVGAGSVSAGTPANFAMLSLAGGGGFLIAAALSQAARRRLRVVGARA